MKRLIPLFLICASAFSQAVRVDIPLLTSGPNVPVTGQGLPSALWVSDATVQICAHPATLSSCSYVTTYTDATEATPCPPTQQIVQLPGNTCSSLSGILGNAGFWYAGGTVDYIITGAYGASGPYTVTGVNGSGNYVSTTQTGTQNMVGPLNGPSFRADVKTLGVVGNGTTDDTAALQTALNSGTPLYLSPGTYKVTGVMTVSSCPNIIGAGSSSIIMNYGTTNNVLNFTFNSTGVVPYCPVQSFPIQQAPSVAHTAGAAIRIGAASGYLQGLRLDVSIGPNFFTGLDLENGQITNYVNVVGVGPYGSGNCIYYNTASPGGDDQINANCSGASANITVNTSDVTHFINTKLNGSGLKFTGAAAVSRIAFDDISIESAPNCAVDFGTGIFTPFISNIQFNGGQMDQTTGSNIIFCHATLPGASGSGPFWSATNLYIDQGASITSAGYTVPSNQYTLNAGPAYFFNNQTNILVGETSASAQLPTPGGYPTGMEVTAGQAVFSLLSAGSSSTAVYKLQALAPDGVTVRKGGVVYTPGNTLTLTTECLYPDNATAVLCAWGDGEAVGSGAFTAQGGLNGPTLAGSGVPTFTLGGATVAGTGATAVCAASHVCDSISGTISLATGTGISTTGPVLTVALPNVRASIPNCTWTAELGATGAPMALFLDSSGTSATQLRFSSYTALTSSTSGNLITYNCGGK